MRLRPLTPKELDQRRAAAKKSTGPRTPDGKARSKRNAAKNGLSVHAKSLWDSMIALGEDPYEFQQLFGSLIKSCRPANAAEMMLVEDIATLAWKKARVDRAQQALCERQLEALELERQRRASAMGRESADASQAAVLESGLHGLKDSPAKFGEMNRVLETLLNKAKNRDYAEDISPAITLLYGKDPTLRGAQIATLYQELREKTQKGEIAELGMLPDRFHLVVLEEISDLTEQGHIYWQDNVCISRGRRRWRRAAWNGLC